MSIRDYSLGQIRSLLRTVNEEVTSVLLSAAHHNNSMFHQNFAVISLRTLRYLNLYMNKLNADQQMGRLIDEIINSMSHSVEEFKSRNPLIEHTTLRALAAEQSDEQQREQDEIYHFMNVRNRSIPFECIAHLGNHQMQRQRQQLEEFVQKMEKKNDLPHRKNKCSLILPKETKLKIGRMATFDATLGPIQQESPPPFLDSSFVIMRNQQDVQTQTQMEIADPAVRIASIAESLNVLDIMTDSKPQNFREQEVIQNEVTSPQANLSKKKSSKLFQVKRKQKKKNAKFNKKDNISDLANAQKKQSKTKKNKNQKSEKEMEKKVISEFDGLTTPSEVQKMVSICQKCKISFEDGNITSKISSYQSLDQNKQFLKISSREVHLFLNYFQDIGIPINFVSKKTSKYQQNNFIEMADQNNIQEIKEQPALLPPQKSNRQKQNLLVQIQSSLKGQNKLIEVTGTKKLTSDIPKKSSQKEITPKTVENHLTLKDEIIEDIGEKLITFSDFKKSKKYNEKKLPSQQSQKSSISEVKIIDKVSENALKKQNQRPALQRPQLKGRQWKKQRSIFKGITSNERRKLNSNSMHNTSYGLLNDSSLVNKNNINDGKVQQIGEYLQITRQIVEKREGSIQKIQQIGPKNLQNIPNCSHINTNVNDFKQKQSRQVQKIYLSQLKKSSKSAFVRLNRVKNVDRKSKQFLQNNQQETTIQFKQQIRDRQKVSQRSQKSLIFFASKTNSRGSKTPENAPTFHQSLNREAKLPLFQNSKIATDIEKGKNKKKMEINNELGQIILPLKSLTDAEEFSSRGSDATPNVGHRQNRFKKIPTTQKYGEINSNYIERERNTNDMKDQNEIHSRAKPQIVRHHMSVSSHNLYRFDRQLSQLARIRRNKERLGQYLQLIEMTHERYCGLNCQHVQSLYKQRQRIIPDQIIRLLRRA